MGYCSGEITEALSFFLDYLHRESFTDSVSGPRAILVRRANGLNSAVNILKHLLANHLRFRKLYAVQELDEYNDNAGNWPVASKISVGLRIKSSTPNKLVATQQAPDNHLQP